MEGGNPEITNQISISTIVDSTYDPSHPNEVKIEFPLSEHNSSGGLVEHAIGTAYTGTNLKSEVEEEVKPEAISEVWLPTSNNPKTETSYPIEIKKEFILSKPHSYVKHEDTNCIQSLDLHIKSEAPDLKCGNESDNEDTYMKFEPLVTEELDIKNETPTRKKPFKCNFCNYSCNRKSHLQKHRKTHTGEKPFKCNVCDYTCIQKTTLQRHMKSHTGEKPFECNVCDYRCIRKSHLQIHVKTHTGEKPFKCNVCDHSCIQKGHLQIHMKTHTGKKPFKCNVCDYRCIQKCHLQTHMKTHTSEKPFKCSVCNYRCIRKGDLKRHGKTHTGEKHFKCNFCDYRCITNCHLQRHMKTHTGEKTLK